MRGGGCRLEGAAPDGLPGRFELRREARGRPALVRGVSSAVARLLARNASCGSRTRAPVASGQQRPLLPADGELPDLVRPDGPGDAFAERGVVLVLQLSGMMRSRGDREQATAVPRVE